MLFKSGLITSASGSIGGMTASRNRFGQYIRSRMVPVNPNTEDQQDQRSAFSTSAAAWRALTSAQRIAWDAYAAATPVTNKLGDTVYLTGAQHYLASASFLLRLGEAAVAAGPILAGRVSLGDPVVAIDAVTGTAISGLTATAATELGVFIGDPISAGRTFFAGPYQLIGHDTVAGGAIVLGGLLGRNGLAFVATQILPVRLAGVDTATGRLTTIWSGLVTVTA